MPQNTAQPSLTGTVREGSTMTAVEGQWSGSPTTFEYQWQRCRNDGTSCLDIAGATAKTYLLTSADVGHAIRVGVTAVNADGTSGAWSDATTLPVASKDGPTVTSRPTLSGTPVVGSTLRVTTGRWSAIDLTFTRQWQRCAISGVGCRDIAGATGASYGVRSADVGHTLRVLVTAHTAAHDQTTAATVVSDTVTATPPPTQTETTTVTTPAAQAPVVKFLSLHRVGMRIHVRFQTCVDSPGMVKIFARDLKTRALPYLRTFTLRVDNGCGTFARSWKLLPRFRHDGRFRVTLRAKDENGLLSQIKARSILLRLKLK
ncbi:MAG TPA: hypothetical protein VFJ91_05545 [Gaiellaceae bacterium]|nr:hypothetical protein [Gaiellaceae bacterium]